MKIIKVSEVHFDACLIIAKQQYLKECERVEALYEEHYERELKERLLLLCKEGKGIVCMEGNRVCGYLITYWDIEKDKSSYIGIQAWGYGACSDNRRKIISYMFQYVAEKVMSINSQVNFEIKVYAHDTDIISYFTFCQFGILCTDGVRNTSDLIEPINEVFCKELSKGEISERKVEILQLHRRLVEYLQKSPVFYPGHEFTDEAYMEYILADTTEVFAAFDDENIIGISDASIEYESFIMNNERIYNVGAIFVNEAYRGKSVAQTLLQYVNNSLIDKGVSKLWVEHGTANPTAVGFWDKYFKDYTYTLVREIKNNID